MDQASRQAQRMQVPKIHIKRRLVETEVDEELDQKYARMDVGQ